MNKEESRFQHRVHGGTEITEKTRINVVTLRVLCVSVISVLKVVKCQPLWRTK
jgi:hypothetical protein